MPTRTDTAATDRFPTDTTGLPACQKSEVTKLQDDATFELEIAPVSKQIGDASVRMLAYNGSIPGPTLQVPQHSEVVDRAVVGEHPHGRIADLL